nr:M20/M25/M40 family metallo-hydrolase [Roseibium sp.]
MEGSDRRSAFPITFLIEGDEENGSPNFADFIKQNSDYLTSEVALVCDTTRYDEDTPAITTMLRRLLKEQITLKTGDRDLHSGHYGGLAPNAALLLCSVLAELKDRNNRVQIPGFYDGIRELPENVKLSWQDLHFDANEYLSKVGIDTTTDLDLSTPLYRLWFASTCEINGISSGYGGEEFKTAIPCQALAKVSIRLAPGQNPQVIRNAFRTFVRSRLPEHAEVSFRALGASPACQMDVESPLFQAAKSALTKEWGTEAVFVGSGGSIPVASHIQEILGIDTLLAGFALKIDRIHSPNEKYDLKSFHKGIRSWVRILEVLHDNSMC